MAELNSATVDDDDKPVTEEDLRALKESMDEVETTKVEDETTEDDETVEESEDTSEEDDKIIDDATEEEDDAEESADEPAAFVKKFDYIKGDTPEEYARNLEQAYDNSSTEGRRINAELQELKASQTAPGTAQPEDKKQEEDPALSPLELYAKQKMDEEIQTAYDDFRKEYPQSADPVEYGKFTNQVLTFSRVIRETEQRLASPAELYSKAAISLGWQKKETAPDAKDKLGMALKDGAATSKTTSGPSKPAPKGPKVTDAMLKANRLMYPGKTDKEIIEELTPYL